MICPNEDQEKEQIWRRNEMISVWDIQRDILGDTWSPRLLECETGLKP